MALRYALSIISVIAKALHRRWGRHQATKRPAIMAGLLTAPVPEVPRRPCEWHAGRLAFERHDERRDGQRAGRRAEQRAGRPAFEQRDERRAGQRVGLLAFERHDGQAFGR